jgi:hypothetical protein
MAIRLIDFNHTGIKEDLPYIKPGHVVKVTAFGSYDD